jgi:hypothetical protein
MGWLGDIVSCVFCFVFLNFVKMLKYLVVFFKVGGVFLSNKRIILNLILID